MTDLQSRTYSRIVLLVLVCVLISVFLLNYIVDPFNKNQLIHLSLPKDRVSLKMNYQLYKILDYANSPQPLIVIGDSRGNSLKREMFAQAGVNDMFNFAYGGGTLYEAIDTFWLANDLGALEKVIFCIPFNLYDDSNNLNRMPTSISVSQNSTTYYLSSLVTKASVYNVLSKLSGSDLKTEKPKKNKDKFWQTQLGPLTSNFYRSWAKPKILKERLADVLRYCTRNDIEFIFVLPPTHVDLQRKVEEFGLSDEYDQYKEDLAQLGTVIDFDFDSDLTRQRENFKDPYHFDSEIAQYIVNVIVNEPREGKNFHVSRVLVTTGPI